MVSRPGLRLGPRYGLRVRKTDHFPSFLRGAMQTAGLSPAELARRAGINDSPISKWLSGTNTPSLEQLRAIAGPLSLRFLDLAVAAGHLTPEEANLDAIPEPPPSPIWSRDAIRDLIRAEFGAIPEVAESVVAELNQAWMVVDLEQVFAEAGGDLTMMTGSGKTMTFVELVRRMKTAGSPVEIRKGGPGEADVVVTLDGDTSNVIEVKRARNRAVHGVAARRGPRAADNPEPHAE